MYLLHMAFRTFSCLYYLPITYQVHTLCSSLDLQGGLSSPFHRQDPMKKPAQDHRVRSRKRGIRPKVFLDLSLLSLELFLLLQTINYWLITEATAYIINIDFCRFVESSGLESLNLWFI